MSDPTPIPPGWYADPDGGPYSRWWDGAQWMAHEPIPETPGVITTPTGVDVRTPWIWFVALLPILGLAILLYDFQPFFDLIAQMPTRPALSPWDVFTPGYFASTLLPLLGTAGTIVFSALDARALSRRGVTGPFPWAWSFFVLVQSYAAVVYPIGRTIVARRRGASASWAPMIVAIVVQLVVLAVSGLWTLQIMSEMFSVMSTLTAIANS